MKEPDDVSAMLKLKALGWGSRRIAAELGCSRTTARRWLKEGAWHRPPSPARLKALDGLEVWLEERFRRHAGNADSCGEGQFGHYRLSKIALNSKSTGSRRDGSSLRSAIGVNWRQIRVP
jgi:hypothetical protein